MNPELVAAESALMTARKKYSETVAKIQNACKHQHAGEIEDHTVNGMRIYRLCLECGISEERFNGKYKIMPNQLVYKLNMRDHGHLRRGLTLDHRDVNALTEKKTTLKLLIEENAHCRHWAGDKIE